MPRFLDFRSLPPFQEWYSPRRYTVSDTNLMYNPSTRKGVLNDFDLALDIRNPTRSVGHCCTGTMPFLSLDLFCHSGELNDGIQCQYYHDEESFRWVLAWIVNCYRNGKFDLPVSNPFWKWDCPKSTWFHRTAFLWLVTKEEELQRLKALPEPDQSIQISVAIMIEQIKSRRAEDEKAHLDKYSKHRAWKEYNPSAEDLLKLIKEKIWLEIPIDMYETE